MSKIKSKSLQSNLLQSNQPFSISNSENNRLSSLYLKQQSDNSHYFQYQNPSDDEQQRQYKQELQEINQEMLKKDKLHKANSKVVVGTGFSFDITEYFKFKKMKDLTSTGNDVLQHLSGGHFAWIILIYSVCNAAMIPAWVMNIQANKFLRISWRSFFQAIMAIPFVLHERRNANTDVQKQYRISYIFDIQRLKTAFFSAFANSFWFTIILSAFQWTFISHAMFLGAQTNYFLSLSRTFRRDNHDLESGGQVLITIGIFIVILDIFQFNPQMAPAQDWTYINPYYLTRTRYESILANISALIVSYCMSKFSVFTQELKNNYPPYLSMMIVNLMVFVMMIFSAYFFNGATFDTDPYWGVFSLFSQQHFVTFMYMAIILCMGMMLSFVMVSKLFPDPIIPSMALAFQPAISSTFVFLAGVQKMPSSLSFVGYILIIPGNLLILIGQWMFKRDHDKKQQDQNNMIAQMKGRIEKRYQSLRKLSEVEKQNCQSDIVLSCQGDLIRGNKNGNGKNKSCEQLFTFGRITCSKQGRNNLKEVEIELKQYKR